MATYQQMMQELQAKRNQVDSIKAVVDSKAKRVLELENQLRQGVVPNNSPQQLDYNMRNAMGPLLAPGNIGEINNVIWPFYFTTDNPLTEIGPDETFQTGYGVTQEAAFIMMSYTKSVYLVEGEDDNRTYTYLDPNNNQFAPGLVFTFRDGSSSRQLFNTPMNIDHYGNPFYPTKFPRPMMLLPNQVFQIAFTNTHSTNRYLPFITAFGYRIRVDQAQNLLSLVYG